MIKAIPGPYLSLCSPIRIKEKKISISESLSLLIKPPVMMLENDSTNLS